MDRFSKLHPTAQLLFFTESFVLIMIVNSPFFSAGALICALLYSFKFKGKAAFKTLGFSAAATAVIGVCQRSTQDLAHRCIHVPPVKTL